MKPATPLLDQLALDIFRPECVETPGEVGAFHPRPMPSLRIACPAHGTPQRYRDPLWRPFKARP